MAEDILSHVQSFYDSPLKEGEKRKILYLFDKEEAYSETIKGWIESQAEVNLLRVTTSNYFHTNVLIEKNLKEKSLFLYFAMERPSIEENPLIDVLLYSEELKVDSESQLYLSLGIDPDDAEITNTLQHYPVFFRSKTRLNQFQRLYHNNPFQSSEVVDYAVFATLTKAASASWMDVLIELFDEAAAGNSSKWDQIVKFGDEKQFWKMIEKILGYAEATSPSGSHSIMELMQQVFLTHLSTELGDYVPKEMKPYLLPKTNPIVVFINQWMNTKDKEEAFVFVSAVIENEWDFDELFQDLPMEAIVECELFSWFDRELIARIVQSICVQIKDRNRLTPFITKRRNTFWHKQFSHEYAFLRWAIQLNQFTEEFEEEWEMLSQLEELWQFYSEQGYHIDQAYRKMYGMYDVLPAERREILMPVKEQMERLYVNKYLETFTQKWDRYYSNSQVFDPRKLQASFYTNEVEAYVRNNRRIVVIISDGLRYEAGKDLYLELTKEKKFNGEFDWMQTELPSITSVGMASLLPHSSLQLKADGTVFADGMPTNSTVNREIILKRNGHEEALAMKSTDIEQLNKEQLREKFAGKKLIYVYHNKVDAIGDHQPTEQAVFDATQDGVSELKQLMTRLTNDVSIGSFLVTADHGYLYTRSSIPTQQKVPVKKESDAWIKNKRFIVSEKEEKHYSGLSFLLSERLDNLGYITVPRGMNRFALQGGGYQYSHGGHLPQEMMVPLLRIKTDRSRNELPEVEISLISQTRTITNTIVWLSFLQTEVVSEEKVEKQVKLYFEDDKGRKISNEVLLIADSMNKSSEERVFKEKFVFLNEKYDPSDLYYFVMENKNDPDDVTKERFKLDLV
ncbi:BREX-1 system phosphatase PglZ type A [Lacticigenium naphthae]|uniref:BREX-1 system phosphatase PglZ type A n=1 Tax=Lacticigenium naphthae TaxID=515351 RepID=UPI000405E619|nr:BREX-1 system phosphatase PglZ type A [Lacticigenium naphthae]